MYHETNLTGQALVDLLDMSASESECDDPPTTSLPASPGRLSTKKVHFQLAPAAPQPIVASSNSALNAALTRKYTFTPMRDSGTTPKRQGLSSAALNDVIEQNGLAEKVARIAQRTAQRQSVARITTHLQMPKKVKSNGKFRKSQPPAVTPRVTKKSVKNPFKSKPLKVIIF